MSYEADTGVEPLIWRTDLENIPEYPIEVLVWSKNSGGYATVTVKGSGEFDYDEAPHITHWMPLPAPPSANDGDCDAKR